MRFKNASEAPEHSYLFPMRFRLGCLAALSAHIFTENGIELQLEGKQEVTLANFDRKFMEARNKAIEKFMEQEKIAESEAPHVMSLVHAAEKKFLLDFVQRVHAASNDTLAIMQQAVTKMNMLLVRVLVQERMEMRMLLELLL